MLTVDSFLFFFLIVLILNMFMQTKLNCTVKMLMGRIYPLKHEHLTPQRQFLGSRCFSWEKRC